MEFPVAGMKPDRPPPRITTMTTHDAPSALLTGALAGYLLAEYGPRLVELLRQVLFIWS